MRTLETARLTLRPFTMDDLQDFYAYGKLASVGTPAGWVPSESVEQSAKLLADFIERDEVYALARKDTARVIGSVGLHPFVGDRGVRSRELGYVLHPDHWGQGFMTEAARRAIAFAFEELGLEVLRVSHFDFNERSRRVIEKCGFAFEGVRRRAYRLPTGDFCDLAQYSLLREEYFEGRGRA